VLGRRPFVFLEHLHLELEAGYCASRGQDVVVPVGTSPEIPPRPICAENVPTLALWILLPNHLREILVGVGVVVHGPQVPRGANFDFHRIHLAFASSLMSQTAVYSELGSKRPPALGQVALCLPA
jgi:hypothetical protein